MLVNRIIKLSTIASKDATRYHLNGVWLSIDNATLPHKIVLEVTDGHRAIREFLPIDESGFQGSSYFEGYFFFDLETIKALKPIAKAWKYGQLPVHYNTAFNTLKVGADLSIEIKRTEFKPPPFKSIYTINDATKTRNLYHAKDTQLQYGVEVPECTVIGLNAKYLLEIAEALKEGKHENVKLIIKNNLSPITVVVGNRDAVLMPVRV